MKEQLKVFPRIACLAGLVMLAVGYLDHQLTGQWESRVIVVTTDAVPPLSRDELHSALIAHPELLDRLGEYRLAWAPRLLSRHPADALLAGTVVARSSEGLTIVARFGEPWVAREAAMLVSNHVLDVLDDGVIASAPVVIGPSISIGLLVGTFVFAIVGFMWLERGS